MIDKNSPLPLYIQVKQTIAYHIESGHYPQGSQIPTEKILIDTFGVGRATIRMALSELVHEGKIIKKHGIGTFVSEGPQPLAFEPLISLSYSLKALGIPSKAKILSNHKLSPSSAFLEQARQNTPKDFQHILRIRYAQDLPIVIEHSYLDATLYQRIQTADLTHSLADLLLHQAHLPIGKLDQSIVFRSPSQSEQNLLQIDSAQYVIQLTRWIYATNMPDPVYYLDFVMVGSALNYPFQQAASYAPQ